MVKDMAIRKATKSICSCCNRNLTTQSNFYPINFDDFLYKDKRLPICKDCCDKLVAHKTNGYKNFIRILMLMNKPFNAEMFENHARNKREYLKTIGKSLAKNEFLESDGFFNANTKISSDAIAGLSPEELRDCQLYWGIGEYTEDDYLYLLTRYEKYCHTYDVDTPSFENIITQICQLELAIRKKQLAGSNVKDETKLILDLMKSAGIAPSQEKESLNNDKNTFGVLLRKIENEKPIPDPLPEFADVDGIEKYIRNSFTSPMMTSLELDNPNEEEYNAHIDKYGISKEDLLGVDKDVI